MLMIMRDPSLRIQGFAIVNLGSVSTKLYFVGYSPCKRTRNLSDTLFKGALESFRDLL